MLARLIKTHQWSQVLVFTRTKHGANKLVEQLARDGIQTMAIHGNKSQSARTKALSEFKDGSLTVLVATDIAARGIDIDQLPHVVNYDLPNVPEDYVHRIGRTGRAGATGEAVSLVCVDEFKLLADIEKFIKRQIPQKSLMDSSLSQTPKPNQFSCAVLDMVTQAEIQLEKLTQSQHAAQTTMPTHRLTNARQQAGRPFTKPDRKLSIAQARAATEGGH